MFSLPLNPKLDFNEFNDFVNFCKYYKKYITDIYVTIRIPPFVQDAMGDVFDQEQANIAFTNAMVVQSQTGIPVSATFNNIDIPPTEENLDIWIAHFKHIYDAGIRTVTLPHTIWMLSGKIQKKFPDLYIKNTILRNVQRPNELVELVKAGFSYINLDRDLMRDTQTLLKIKEAKEYCIKKYNRDIKVSILANEGCWGNCVVQDEHFQYNSSRSDFSTPTYFMTNLSKYTCPKWELEDNAFELKKANMPPWRDDWVEMHEKYGIDVFKMHGREHIPRMFESMSIIRKFAKGYDIVSDNFEEYIKETNLENNPINIWRSKIKECKFNCWKCSYCDKVVESRTKTKLINHINISLQDALNEKSNISDSALNVNGLISPKVKHLLNNICSMDGAKYLEVGSYQGASLTAAISNNNIPAIAIDNWSTPEISPMRKMDFDIEIDPKSKFLNNVKDKDIIVIDSSIEDICELPHRSNIIFYDGDHEYQSHQDAFNILDKHLDNIFIAIIDDYNWPQVQEAMGSIKYKVLYMKEIYTSGEDLNDFWNGLGIFVFEKYK